MSLLIPWRSLIRPTQPPCLNPSSPAGSWMTPSSEIRCLPGLIDDGGGEKLPGLELAHAKAIKPRFALAGEATSLVSPRRPVRTVRVGKFRVPVTTPMRSEIENVVDGSQEIDSPFLDILGHPGVRRVRVTKVAVAVARKD